MTSASKEQTETLEQILHDLETAVGTPIVPGELQRWCRPVATLFGSLIRQFEDHVRHNHGDTYRSIEREDAEMLGRVGLLKKKDEQFGRRIAELNKALRTAKIKTAVVGANEGAVMPDIQAFIRTTQMLIVDIRQQEIALRTWLQEAVNRDRGIAD